MLSLRSHVYIYIIQKSICQLAPFVFLIMRYLLSIKLSTYVTNMCCLFWILIHIFEIVISHQEIIIYFIKIRFLNELLSLYENLGIQALFSYLQQRIKVTMLLKIFWLTKIMIIPLGIRTIYTNPFITHNTTDGNITNEMITDYNETLSKTIYFTTVFYGTETMFT